MQICSNDPVAIMEAMKDYASRLRNRVESIPDNAEFKTIAKFELRSVESHLEMFRMSINNLESTLLISRSL
jgi:hypothetical protein